MKNWRAAPVLLCGAVFVVAGCADPAGVGESRDPSHTVLAVSSGPLDLGTLGGPNSSAADINDAGVVVGSSDVAGEIHAFRWTRARGMVDLGTVGGTFSAALRINRYGVVLGLSRDASNELHIVLWTPQNRLRDLGKPPGPWTFDVVGLNDRNEILGTIYNWDGYPNVFKWSELTGYVNLGEYPSHAETYAAGIDNDGSYVGTRWGLPHAYYGWFLVTRPTEFVTIGAPTTEPYGNAWAEGMNDLHQIVGWDAPGGGLYYTAPYVWTPRKGFKYLGTLGGTDGYAGEINNQGEIVGGSTTLPWDDTDPSVGFYYSDRLGMVRLPGLDGGLTSAGGINLYGQIAGSATTAAGLWHAVVWNRPRGPSDSPPLLASAPRMASSRFGECLENREIQRSRALAISCLANGAAGVRVPR